ncbi:MAG: universal stress protein [Bryobacterales bacterium]|nr:universal stress protein [Bryobacterales bacterium]
MRLAKILLPVDFSDRSVIAAHYAHALAVPFNSEVIMVHVVRPLDYAMGGAELTGAVGAEWYASRLDDWKKQLDQFQVHEFEGLQVRRIVLEGNPSEEIVALSQQEKCDLIVMPTHGYGPFRRFLIGSVTARVLHDAECPVFTGTHLAVTPASERLMIRRLLCAVDFGPQSEAMLLWASKFAQGYGASLHLVHALPALSSGEARYLDEEIQVNIARQARAQSAKLLAHLQLEAEVILEHGDPARVVHDAAKRVGADLVVIGRHVSAGILGRLRTHAYAIVRESPVPVVSI